jgi:two-component system, OmpR family, alkaline phosphatase synthesis response regulator PhoP
MKKKTTILIIDDEKDFCHFVKVNLESTKRYKVVASTDGRDGVKKAVRKKPDIIFLDVKMPGVDGYEVLKLLKENIHTTSVPVVMLTAMRDDEHKKLASEGYSHDYLTKPIRMEQLIAKIDALLFFRRY